MTPKEIKTALKRNRAVGQWPSSLAAIARRKRVSRSMVSNAVADGERYPRMRLYIEACLANGRSSVTRK